MAQREPLSGVGTSRVRNLQIGPAKCALVEVLVYRNTNPPLSNQATDRSALWNLEPDLSNS